MDLSDFNKIPIDGYERYLVNRKGDVYSQKSHRILIQHDSNGYKKCSFFFNKKKLNCFVHRLVAITYIPNPNNYEIVDHINTNKTDNRLENLQWLTQKENINRNEKKTSHERKVCQFSLKYEFIKSHESITNAAIDITNSQDKEVIKKARQCISKNCNGKNNTALKYIWEFDDEENYKIIPHDFDDSKLIYHYPNYFIFKDGRVYNKRNKQYLKPILDVAGYTEVTLCKKGEKKKNISIHIIVYDHFGSKIKENRQPVYHINRIKSDNRIENLTLNLKEIIKK